MQILLHVLCTRGSSLRAEIVRDRSVKGFGLEVTEAKRPKRRPGWAKVHSSSGERGALNIEWHANSNTLTCRAVTRASRKTSVVVGNFVNYLLQKHRARINAVLISQR